MLPRVPEESALPLRERGGVGDDQFPVLASPFAGARQTPLEVGMGRQRADEAYIVAIGVPGAQADPGFTRRRGETHRAYPAPDLALNLLPVLARGADEQEVARGHASPGRGIEVAAPPVAG